MNEKKVVYNGRGVLDEDGTPKHNGTYCAFETITSLLIESYYPEDFFIEDGDILYLGDEAIMVQQEPRLVNGCTEDVVIVSLNLTAQPMFVFHLTELLINTCVNYDIGESFIYGEDGLIIFESEMDICPDCRKEQDTN